MSKPIHNPSIPYIGSLPIKFSPGKTITIYGSVSPLAERFDINLQCGSETTPQDDIALQVSFRPLEPCIILNSLQAGIWGNEQRLPHSPIKRGEKFKIEITCESNEYKVTISEDHCVLPQRIPHYETTHLAIDGDVSISEISYDRIVTFSTESERQGTSKTNDEVILTVTTPPPTYETAVSHDVGVVNPTFNGGGTHPPTISATTVPINSRRRSSAIQQAYMDFKLEQDKQKQKDNIRSYGWLILCVVCAAAVILTVGVVSIRQKIVA